MNHSKYYILLLIICFSCLNTENKQKLDHQTIISADIDVLKTIINFQEYEPKQVEWKYWKLGSQSNERTSVPRPIDYALEAKLVFDMKPLQALKRTI